MNKAKTPKYSPEVRERAVRMVQEHRGEYSSPSAAVESIAPKIGCSPHTLHEWVKRHEVDTGLRDGVTSRLARHVTTRRAAISNCSPFFGFRPGTRPLLVQSEVPKAGQSYIFPGGQRCAEMSTITSSPLPETKGYWDCMDWQ